MNRIEQYVLSDENKKKLGFPRFFIGEPDGIGYSRCAGPPRVVRFKHRILPSDLLGSMLVFTNFPLRTYGFFPSQTYQQKTPPQGRGFLLVSPTGFEPMTL